MRQDKIVELGQGLRTAFINQNEQSNLAYKPQFVSNNYKEGRKVISSIEDELSTCEEFFISVAFITMSGITPLLQTLKELEQKGIPGKILTTDYLMFSDPKALQCFQKRRNLPDHRRKLKYDIKRSDCKSRMEYKDCFHGTG